MMQSRPNSLLRIAVIVALVMAAAMGVDRCACGPAPDAEVQGTGRRPLVIVSGQTEQLPATDYISSAGGVSTNATPAAAGDIQTTTETVGQLAYTVQTSTITGTNDNVALNATTTIFRWNGIGAATITGFTGGVAGRVLVVNNVSTQNLTLSNLTGSSAGNQLQLFGNTSEVIKAQGSATFVYDATTTTWRNIALASTQVNASMAFNATTVTTKNLSATGNLTATQSVSGQVTITAGGPTAHYRALVGSPESVTCGSNPTVAATDAGGEITIGTSSGGNCTVNFGATYTNAPACTFRFHDAATNNAVSYTTTPNTLAITGASDGKTFDFFCLGSI